MVACRIGGRSLGKHALLELLSGSLVRLRSFAHHFDHSHPNSSHLTNHPPPRTSSVGQPQLYPQPRPPPRSAPHALPRPGPALLKLSAPTRVAHSHRISAALGPAPRARSASPDHPHHLSPPAPARRAPLRAGPAPAADRHPPARPALPPACAHPSRARRHRTPHLRTLAAGPARRARRHALAPDRCGRRTLHCRLQGPVQERVGRLGRRQGRAAPRLRVDPSEGWGEDGGRAEEERGHLPQGELGRGGGRCPVEGER